MKYFCKCLVLCLLLASCKSKINVISGASGSSEQSTPQPLIITKDRNYYNSTGYALTDGSQFVISHWITNTITTFDNNGVPLQRVGNNGLFENNYSATLTNTRGIAKDSDGSYYVITDFNKLCHFDSNWNQLSCFSGTVTTAEEFANPQSVVIGPDNNLWIVDRASLTVIKFSKSGVFDSAISLAGTSNPTYIVFNSFNEFYISSYSNDRVYKYNLAGVQQSFINTCDGPQGIFIDSSDNVYVTCRGDETIEVYNSADANIDTIDSTDITELSFIYASPYYTSRDSSGNYYIFCSTGFIKTDSSFNILIKKINFDSSAVGLATPSGLNFNNNQELMVADERNHRIVFYEKDGTYIRSFGSPGTGNGEFNKPQSIIQVPNGDYFVADTSNQRVCAFNENLVFKFCFGSAGAADGQFSLPWSLVYSGGFIYVTDYGNHRVQYFDLVGAFQGKWGINGSNNGEFINPLAIAAFSNGDIAVSDNGNDAIQIFDSTGAFIRKFGGSGSAAGQLDYPFSLAITSDQKIYVTEYTNNRISLFSKLGVHEKSLGDGSYSNSEGSFNNPSGVAISSEGNIYFSQWSMNAVRAINADGSPVEY